MSLEIGSVVEGVVTGVMGFGAFVDLPEGKSGLIHISEISSVFVEDIRQFVKENDKVNVKILGVNDKGKYDLSIKQTLPQTQEQPQKPPQKNQIRQHTSSDGKMSFEDKLSRFMKESEERLLDLKRNTENKRGRSRPR